ncbi:DUF3052 domain-containing protein [Luteimicrobium subarcticum]|uniref:DUF3052 family protein n=1 Tax=Luteimicrobium subarcticum TaxID=620910 RepID=A0A2M8WR67_9MICO|nr:DUF3052 domain-containing protein [Luteimicrobium subarcticum]PJI93419.1 Protein of unknown function (DUF3052) [Luteimicrobium subarcticum]
MVAAADPSSIERLGLEPGFVVQEYGWGDDCDEQLREAVEGLTGNELVDEEYDDVTDAVIAWYRDGDGDLTDLLVDVQVVLDDGGPIWVLTPKTGRPGHVAHAEIQEAASTAGLHAMGNIALAPDWTATRLANRGRGR